MVPGARGGSTRHAESVEAVATSGPSCADPLSSQLAERIVHLMHVGPVAPLTSGGFEATRPVLQDFGTAGGQRAVDVAEMRECICRVNKSELSSPIT